MYKDRVFEAVHRHDITRTHVVHLRKLNRLFSGLSRVV